MQHRIEGGNLPVLIVTMEPGETMVTERGGMSWMSPNVHMDTNMKGGLMKGLGRALSGESVFLNTYTCQGGQGELACSSSFPGNILEFDLAAGESIIAQKGSFLCGESSVTLSVHLRKKVGVGFFGGEGFIMQRMEGPGKVYLEINGSCVKKTLQHGEELIVDPGHIAVQSPSITTDIRMVKGMKNIFLGGEGLFLAHLTGPGEVWLQTMTAANLAQTLMPYMPQNNS